MLLARQEPQPVMLMQCSFWLPMPAYSRSLPWRKVENTADRLALRRALLRRLLGGKGRAQRCEGLGVLPPRVEGGWSQVRALQLP